MKEKTNGAVLDMPVSEGLRGDVQAGGLRERKPGVLKVQEELKQRWRRAGCPRSVRRPGSP